MFLYYIKTIKKFFISAKFFTETLKYFLSNLLSVKNKKTIQEIEWFNLTLTFNSYKVCFTRSCSSEAFPSLNRSKVPTK